LSYLSDRFIQLLVFMRIPMR